jgi:hypothetical protein
MPGVASVLGARPGWAGRGGAARASAWVAPPAPLCGRALGRPWQEGAARQAGRNSVEKLDQSIPRPQPAPFRAAPPRKRTESHAQSRRVRPPPAPDPPGPASRLGHVRPDRPRGPAPPVDSAVLRLLRQRRRPGRAPVPPAPPPVARRDAVADLSPVLHRVRGSLGPHLLFGIFQACFGTSGLLWHCRVALASLETTPWRAPIPPLTRTSRRRPNTHAPLPAGHRLWGHVSRAAPRRAAPIGRTA